MPTMTLLQAISDALRYEMRRDERVFLLGEDIAEFGGAFKVTKGFVEEFGKHPIAEIQFMDFITNGFNQLVNVAATTAYRWGLPVPIVVRGPVGGGMSAGPFHSRSAEAWFAHTPGLKVVFPAFPADAKGLLIAAIRDPNPVLFFEHKGLYRKVREDVPEGEHVVPLGTARIVRPGTDLSIITYGRMVHIALEVAANLENEGASVEVVDIRTLVPFDEATVIDSVKRTNRVVITHEATLTAGFGAEIAARIADKAFEYLDAPIRRIAAFDAPVPMAPPLEQAMLPSKEKLLDTCRQVLEF